MPRVLVVDDEPDLRLALRRLLTSRGFDVVLAEHGAEAILVLQNEHVDVVVLDVSMPTMEDRKSTRLNSSH